MYICSTKSNKNVKPCIKILFDLAELRGCDVVEVLPVEEAVGGRAVGVVGGAVEFRHGAGERGHVLLDKAAEACVD